MCQHPWFLMRRAILEVQISEGIESIGTYAFQEMWRTTTISVPKSVNHISDTAFEQLYQTKIMCYANSYTEEYAKVHNISYDTFCEEKNPISSHSYGEWTITEEPTCDTFGSRRRTCNVCGYVKMENVQPLGHDFENGKCKVCGCLDPESIDVPSEPLRFSSASLTLQDNIAINLKARTTLFTEVGYTDPYVVFELNGVETVVTESYTSGKNTVFDFTNIAPHQMNDRVTATLYAKYNGEEYEGYSYVYGVFAYCDNMLSKYTTDEYAKLRTLLVDLLNYGAESQMYTGYKTDNLVNGFLTEEQKAWGTASSRTYENLLAPAYETINHPSVTWKAAGLNLKDRVEIRVKFLADDINNLVIKVRDDNGNNWEIKADKFEAIPEGGYYAYFNGLNAGMMSEPVYFTVYDGEQKVSNTLRYSVESYAYSKVNGTDAALSTLVQAMMKYGDAAYSYVN